ncbi:unnamed protein product [Agarophyton chilense]
MRLLARLNVHRESGGVQRGDAHGAQLRKLVEMTSELHHQTRHVALPLRVEKVAQVPRHARHLRRRRHRVFTAIRPDGPVTVVHSFLSDPSRVTTKLVDALLNNRVGVADAHIHTKDLLVPVSRSVLIALNSYLADYACSVSFTAPPDPDSPALVHAKPLPILAHQLRNVLEFVYTNDCAFVRNMRSSILWRKDTDVPPTTIVDIIHLAHAAHICHTPELSNWCENTALAVVRHKPNLLCSALNTIMNCSTANAHHLIDLWMSRVFQQPAYFLGSVYNESSPLQLHPTTGDLRTPVVDLDANTLARILKSRQDNDEYYFRALYCWATRGYTEFVRAGARWRNAIKLVSRIDFTKVSSKFLLGFVDSSGLISEQDMPAIIRKHLAAKSNLPQSYGMHRSKDRPPKRKNTVSGHHTDHSQKKPRLEPAHRSYQTSAVNQASPTAQLHQSKPPAHSPRQHAIPENAITRVHAASPMPRTPRTHRQVAPPSSVHTFSLVSGAGDANHQSQNRGREPQPPSYMRSPPNHRSQVAPQPNGSALHERSPCASTHRNPPRSANCILPRSYGANSIQRGQAPTSALAQSNDAFKEVKEEVVEDVKPKVKEEYELLHV